MSKITVDDQKHIFCSVSVAAYNLGITRQALLKWMKGRDVPKNGSDIDFTEMLSLRRQKQEQQEEDLSDAAKKLKAEVKYKTARTKQEEIIFNQMISDLIPQEEVKAGLENVFSEIEKTLSRLPDDIKTGIKSISPEIAIDCEEVAREVVKKALERLASGKSIVRAENTSKEGTRHYIKRKT